MSPELTTKQKLFIRRMAENQEQAKWGFEILVNRHDSANFFDDLKEANLFSPENNSGPVPAEDPGYVRVPYWSALDYLETTAKQAGDSNDIPLAQKVMDVVRSVSNYRDSDGSSRDNYHTYHKFAKILGLVPIAAITIEDLNPIPVWLHSKYDRGTIAHELDIGVLRRLLESDSTDDWQKASMILRYCTAIAWVEEKDLGGGRKKPIPVVDDYWLRELIKHHAHTFGIKAGRQASQVFYERIHEVFGEYYADLPTYLSRPAIEDHPQNHSWDGLVNSIVEGFRDVLLSWTDNELEGASAFVAEILVDGNEMVRRIAIYVVAQRWSLLKDLFSNLIGPKLFDSRNIHELYQLLKERFIEFSDSQKAATLESLRQLPLSSDHDKPDLLLRHTQRNWLSAIAGKGYEPADIWFRELETDRLLGNLSEHPDFHAYMETWSGPGPSPYSAQELLAFSEDGSLIERLNHFQQSDEWRGPSVKALVNSLEEAVGKNPNRFLRLLPAFPKAKRPYQYGVINGFKRLWDMSKEKEQDLKWDTTWETLIEFFWQLLGNPEFWLEQVDQDYDLTPTRNWIPPIIAEFLHSGTKNDDKAYSQDLLPRTFSLIKILLVNLKPEDQVKEDAMFQAINSSKGKALEALFSYTLRVCRINDAQYGDHSDAWNEIKSTFDVELTKCKNGNYEFSTLAAAYLVNIDYISRDWLETNVTNIFPHDYQANFLCAIDGLAYTSATRSIYTLLIDHAVLDSALRLQLSGRHARERLIERIALAYLWGDEQLDSPRFMYLFGSGRIDDLQDTSRFFHNVRGKELTEDQIERILSFGEKCVNWAETLREPPKSLLSELSRLICYVTTFTDREYTFLLAVAKHVKVGYNADTFIEELDRLVEIDPARVSSVLEKVLDAYDPDYDYEDRLKRLLIKLAQSGRRNDVLIYADRIRRLPGIEQLFKQLSEGEI